MSLEVRVEQSEKEIVDIKKTLLDLIKDNIRTDEKYNTILATLSTLTTASSESSKILNDVIIKLALNDQTTNRTNAKLESITIPKIITVIVGIIAIISFWKA